MKSKNRHNGFIETQAGDFIGVKRGEKYFVKIMRGGGGRKK